MTRLPTLLAVGMLLVLPSTAAATVYTLSPDGTGDFPTIQAAVDSLFDVHPADDTLALEPGFYDEVVAFGAGVEWRGAIIGAGESTTRIRGFSFDPLAEFGSGVIGRGLSVDSVVHQSRRWAGSSWTECRFAGGFICTSLPGEPCPSFSSCRFVGRNRFVSGPPYQIADCTFSGGTTLVDGSSFGIELLRCTFEDCPDTALFAVGDIDDGVRVRECTFRRVGRAIVANGESCTPGGCLVTTRLTVDDCDFEDVTGVACENRVTVSQSGSILTAFTITNNRFLRCGAGIRLRTPNSQRLTISRNLFDATSGVAIDVDATDMTMEDDTVRAGMSDGVRFRLNVHPSSGVCTLRRLRISGNAGAGLAVSDSVFDSSGGIRPINIENCLIADNEGTGLNVTSQFSTPGEFVTARFNRIVRNGAGASFTLGPDAKVLEVRNNTIAQSSGIGLQVTMAAVAPPQELRVENNIVALGASRGIDVAGAYGGHARHNDAWMNLGGDLSGVAPGDTNLVLDPLFCDVSSDDFRLASTSPCAPSGPYGLIGALDVGCLSTAVTASLIASTAEPGVVRLEWHVVGAINSALTVERRTEDVDWVAVGPGVITGHDRVSFVDFDVVSGRRYAYRLVDAGEPASPETWVDVPSLVFALEGAHPNPSGPTPVVAFTLATAGPVRLAIHDLAGRRLAGRTLSGLSAGRHVMPVEPGLRLAPGVYWVALTQGSSRATVRLSVLR